MIFLAIVSVGTALGIYFTDNINQSYLTKIKNLIKLINSML